MDDGKARAMPGLFLASTMLAGVWRAMRVTSVTHDPDEIALLFIFATASVASSVPAPSRRIFPKRMS